MTVNKTQKKKQNKDEKIYLRCESSKKKKLQKNAQKRNMSLTEYLFLCADAYDKNDKKQKKTASETQTIIPFIALSNTLWKENEWKYLIGVPETVIDILKEEEK